MNFLLYLKAISGWWLPPVIGSIIGFTTNWLAIRMLFRPYRAYYIGKLKIPFTPGVIPNRRSEIASKVGQVVAQYLFNETELSRTLLEPAVRNGIVNFLTIRWQTLMQTQISLDTLLQELPEERKRQGKQQIADQLTQFIAKALRQRTVRDQLNRVLQEQWQKTMLLHPPQVLLDYGRTHLSDQLEIWLTQDYLRQSVKASITERFRLITEQWQSKQTTLAELLGENGYRDTIKFLFEHRTHLTLLLKGVLADAELVKELVPFVKRLLEKQWTLNFLSSFISEEHMLKIITSLLTDVDAWLDQDENQSMLIQRLSVAFDEFAQKPLSEKLFSPDGLVTEKCLEEWIDMLWQGLCKTIDRNTIDNWLAAGLKQVEGSSWQQLAERFGMLDLLEKLPAAIWQILDREMVSEQRQVQISHFLQEQIDQLCAKPFSEFLAGWQPQERHWQQTAQWLQVSSVKILPELL
ncbi:MAG TPA: DUF445 family protein, partial [Bacillota bacterium]|nr:DUF445 family protein [Bacillota bacterium]